MSSEWKLQMEGRVTARIRLKSINMHLQNATIYMTPSSADVWSQHAFLIIWWALLNQVLPIMSENMDSIG